MKTDQFIIKHLKKIYIIMSALLLLSFLSSCERNHESSAESKHETSETDSDKSRADSLSASDSEDILRFSESLNVCMEKEARLNPLTDTEGQAGGLLSLFYECLFLSDEQENLLPVLADKIEHVSSSEYILKIKNNIVFQNGDILTARHLKESFSYILDNKDFAAYDNLQNISLMEVENSRSLRIWLKKPDEFFPGKLTFPIFIIEEKEDDFLFWGSGPYLHPGKFSEQNESDFLIVKAFLNHRDTGQYKIKEIKIHLLEDIREGLHLFFTGRLDLFYLDDRDYQIYSQRKSLNLKTFSGDTLVYFLFEEEKKSEKDEMDMNFIYLTIEDILNQSEYIPELGRDKIKFYKNKKDKKLSRDDFESGMETLKKTPPTFVFDENDLLHNLIFDAIFATFQDLDLEVNIDSALKGEEDKSQKKDKSITVTLKNISVDDIYAWGGFESFINTFENGKISPLGYKLRALALGNRIKGSLQPIDKNIYGSIKDAWIWLG